MPTHLWQVLLVIIFRKHVLMQTSQENGAYTHTYQEAHTYAYAPLAGPPRHHLPRSYHPHPSQQVVQAQRPAAAAAEQPFAVHAPGPPHSV